MKIPIALTGMDPATRDLLLAQDGDSTAFSRFMAEADGDVRRFCSWFTRPGHEIDDLVQETFLRAYRGMNSFSGRSSARSWLITIARRVCLDHASRRQRDAAVTEEWANAVSLASDIGTAVSGALLIDELSDDFRDAFVLVRILGHSYDEAAVILGCPRGTVQSRVARARAALSTSFHDTARSDVG